MVIFMEKKNTGLKHNYSAKEDRSVGSVLFGIIGKMIIAIVLIICIPVAVPQILGYEVYNIVSGSMEPEISIGSAIYTKAIDNPEKLAPGEIAVFEKEGFVVAHRVVLNDIDNHVIRTKGDANAAEDMNPVEYQNILGTVSFNIKFIGTFAFLFGSVQGKMYLLAFLAGGIFCNIISSILKRKNNSNYEEDEKIQTKSTSDAQRKLKVLMIVGGIIAVLFIGVLGVIAKIYLDYAKERKTYDNLAENVININENVDKEISEVDKKNICPIDIDFNELRAENPEIIGWIYCEDTVINYPICYSGDNDYYLKHAYDGTAKKSGAIFMEAANDSGFIDHNNIIYGHHMKDKSMFATLSYWSAQDYYEEHPYMWILTPEKKYRVDLISGYYTVANADAYVVYQGYSELLNEYIETAIRKSNFKTDVSELIGSSDYANEQYVLLSTCEYTSENARYVLHGVLHEIK